MNLKGVRLAGPEDIEPHIRDVIDRTNRMPSKQVRERLQYVSARSITMAIAEPFEGPGLDEAMENSDIGIGVRFLPWGNTATPNNFNQPLQTQILADMVDRPIVAVSSPAIGSSFELNRRDRKQVASGDFDPAAREIFSALDEVLPSRLARVAFFGASQGAVLAVNTASYGVRSGQVLPDSVLAMGLPTVKERNRSELMDDFSKAGFSELYETLLDGGVPQLVTANNMSLKERPASIGKFVIGSTANMLRHPVLGLALSGGMGKAGPTWDRDIPTLLEGDVKVELVGEGKGAIMPVEDLKERAVELKLRMERDGTLAKLGNLTLSYVVNGNHTMADHIPTVGGILRQSLLRAT